MKSSTKGNGERLTGELFFFLNGTNGLNFRLVYRKQLNKGVIRSLNYADHKSSAGERFVEADCHR
jgi:hypothetical protein